MDGAATLELALALGRGRCCCLAGTGRHRTSATPRSRRRSAGSPTRSSGRRARPRLGPDQHRARRQLNAFVAGGQNLFLNTGLLMRSRGPGPADRRDRARDRPHSGRPSEPGRRPRSAARPPRASWLPCWGRRPRSPVRPGGDRHHRRRRDRGPGGVLGFSRAQEQSADQAALTYLDRAGRSPERPGRVLPDPGEPERPGAAGAPSCGPTR